MLLVGVTLAGVAGTVTAQTADDPISYGDSVQGELNASDDQSTAYRGYHDLYVFSGSAGDTVTIDMESTGDTYLILLGPDSTEVVRNDDGGSGLDGSIEQYTLQSTGQYTIVATSFSSTATFAYTLSLTDEGTSSAATDLRSISYGETASGEIDISDPQSSAYRGYYEPVTFSGSAGDVVSIDMESTDDSYLILLGPDGTEVVRNDDGGSGLDASIEQYRLAETGQYTIVATSFSSSDTFDYTLSLTDEGTSSATTDLRSISNGETASGEIDTSDPQSSAYRGYYEPVTFSGSAGDTVTIDMSSESDTYLFLLGPSGDELTRDDDGGDWLDSSIERYTLPSSGQYTIVATSYDSSDTFEYTLSLRSVPTDVADDRFEANDGFASATTLSPGSYDDLQITGQNDDYYAVELDTGDELTVSIDFTDANGDLDMTVYGPDQDYIRGSTSVTDDESITVTASSSGTYYVHVYGWAGATGPYNMTLETVAGSATTDLRSIAYGQRVSGQLDTSDPQSSQYRGYYEPVTFSGAAGDVVSIDMESTGDTYLLLLDPSGNEVTRDDDGGSGLDSRIEQYTLQSTGQYTIVATSFSSTAMFPYSLELSQIGGVGSSNLTLSASGGQSAVGGETVTLQFDLENTGTSSQAVVVEVGPALETLPGNWTITSHQDAGATWRATEGTWLFQQLAPGQPVSPTVTVQPPSNAAGTYTVPVRAFSSDQTVTASVPITIQDGPTSLADAIDTNDDSRIGDSEILDAIDYWQSDEPVPGHGTTISNIQMIELTDLWSSGHQFA